MSDGRASDGGPPGGRRRRSPRKSIGSVRAATPGPQLASSPCGSVTATQLLPVGASVEAPRPSKGAKGSRGFRGLVSGNGAYLAGVVTRVNSNDDGLRAGELRPTYDVSYDVGGPPGLSLPGHLVRPALPPPNLCAPPLDIFGARLVPNSFRSGQRDCMSAEEYAALLNHAGLFREAHSEPGAVVSAPLGDVHPAMAAAAAGDNIGSHSRRSPRGTNGRLEVAPSSELESLSLFAVLDLRQAAEDDPAFRRLIENNLNRGFGLGHVNFRLDDALSMPDGGWPYDYAAVGIGTVDESSGGPDGGDGDSESPSRRGRLSSVRAVCLALVYRWADDDAIDLPDLPHYSPGEGKPFVVTHLHVDSVLRGRGLGTYLIQCLQTLYRTLGRGRPKLLLAVDDTRDALGRWYDGRDVARTRWEDNCPCIRHYAAYNGFAAAAPSGDGARSRAGGSEGAGYGARASRLRDRATRRTVETTKPSTGTKSAVDGTRSDSGMKGGDNQGMIMPRMTRNFTASRGVRQIHVRPLPVSLKSPAVEACAAAAPEKGAAGWPRWWRAVPEARKRKRDEACPPPAKRSRPARPWSPGGLLLRIASECVGMLGRATATGWRDGESLKKPTKDVVVKIEK